MNFACPYKLFGKMNPVEEEKSGGSNKYTGGKRSDRRKNNNLEKQKNWVEKYPLEESKVSHGFNVG